MMYVVIENGEPYPDAFKTYKQAVAAVKEKHAHTIEDHIRQMGDLASIESILADINVPESPTNRTNLYIEKGINIVICLFTVT
jgi:hypothetical protein